MIDSYFKTANIPIVTPLKKQLQDQYLMRISVKSTARGSLMQDVTSGCSNHLKLLLKEIPLANYFTIPSTVMIAQLTMDRIAPITLPLANKLCNVGILPTYTMNWTSVDIINNEIELLLILSRLDNLNAFQIKKTVGHLLCTTLRINQENSK